MVLIVSHKSLVGFDPALDIKVSTGLVHNLGRRTSEQIGFCFAMYSSYKSKDQGENLNLVFETRSRTSEGAIAPRISMK